MRNAESTSNRTLCPAEEVLQELVTRVLPGDSRAIKELRGQVITFCANPGARTLLLRGPVGSGKSTLARLVAFGKRIAPLLPDEAKKLIDKIRWEAPGLIDPKSEMSFYVELTVTGLVDTLASSQLFGHVRGAFTGAVSDNRGVFEQASTGRGGDPRSGAGVTGGVVFLDEIVDVSLDIQAKLLPVLSGGQFYPVGGEGRANRALTYDGIVIAASWQDLDPNRMRRDLLSRLSANTIEVPSVTERPEDIPDIVTEIQGHMLDRFARRIHEISIADPKVARAFWLVTDLKDGKLGDSRLAFSETMKGRIESCSNKKTIERLSTFDWSRHGELRGLTQALQRTVIGGEDLDDVLTNLSSSLDSTVGSGDSLSRLVQELRERSPDGGGLASHVKAIQLKHRAALKELIYINRAVRFTLAETLDIEESTLRKQAADLPRERRIVSSGKAKS